MMGRRGAPDIGHDVVYGYSETFMNVLLGPRKPPKAKGVSGKCKFEVKQKIASRGDV
jgi:hypothetical protein